MDISLFELQFKQISQVYNDGRKIVKVGVRDYGNLCILIYRKGSEKLHLEQTIELTPTQFEALQRFINSGILRTWDENSYAASYETVPVFTNYSTVENDAYSHPGYLENIEDFEENKENIPPTMKTAKIKRLFSKKV